MSSKESNKRNWTFIVYPESAPSNWVDILTEMGVFGCISPLHDKDVNPDGTLKKPHYHVLVVYDGPKSFNSVNKYVSELKQPIPIPVESVKGMYRYFTHEDNPEKVQYNKLDIRSINGFSIRDFVELTTSQVNTILKELQSMIRECDIYEYCDLMDKLMDEDLIDYYDVASSHTYFIEKYISSRRNKFRELIRNS